MNGWETAWNRRRVPVRQIQPAQVRNRIDVKTQRVFQICHGLTATGKTPNRVQTQNHKRLERIHAIKTSTATARLAQQTNARLSHQAIQSQSQNQQVIFHFFVVFPISVLCLVWVCFQIIVLRCVQLLFRSI